MDALALDIDIARNLPRFLLCWIFGNVAVGGVCACVLQGFDPVFTAAGAILTLYMSVIPLADAQPAMIRRKLAVFGYSVGCAVVAVHLGQTFLAPGGNAPVYNPTIFTAGFVSLTVVELYSSCAWNLLVFMVGMLFRAVMKPHQYWLWGSRLSVVRLDAKPKLTHAPPVRGNHRGRGAELAVVPGRSTRDIYLGAELVEEVGASDRGRGVDASGRVLNPMVYSAGRASAAGGAPGVAPTSTTSGAQAEPEEGGDGSGGAPTT